MSYTRNQFGFIIVDGEYVATPIYDAVYAAVLVSALENMGNVPIPPDEAQDLAHAHAHKQATIALKAWGERQEQYRQQKQSELTGF